MNNHTQFAPTPKQKALLSVMQAKDYNVTVKAACKGADVARQTYYEWQHNPAFRLWWIGEMDHHFSLRLAKVYACIFQAATERRGKSDKRFSPVAQRLMLERFDKNFTPQRKHMITGHVAGYVPGVPDDLVGDFLAHVSRTRGGPPE